MTGLLQSAQYRIINAVGYATRIGGSKPDELVLQAMIESHKHYYEIDDLLRMASKKIAAITGAEAGLVTSSASAALTLGAAAVLAGDNLEIMDRLPDVSGISRNTFLYPVSDSYDYDHPIRCSGAKLKVFSFESNQLEERLLSEFDESIAGVVYVWQHRDESCIISRVAAVCRSAGVPFLVDAAMSLPPSENLRGLIALGPNLVALSGGKHLGGPQNSGVLFGDAPLIRSAWLQMVDMDVRADSWSRSDLISQNILSRPPRHGVGRGFKVGKDTILGCLAALEAYPGRDFAGERKRWNRHCREIATDVRPSSALRITHLPENSTGQYPVVEVRAGSPETMKALKLHLKSQTPKIILAEDAVNNAVAYIYPMCLEESDIGEILNRMASFQSV